MGTCKIGSEDNPWFVGANVEKALGGRNPAEALKYHYKKVMKSTITLFQSDGKRHPPVNVNLIPESDVYRLIFGSKLESAER